MIALAIPKTTYQRHLVAHRRHGKHQSAILEKKISVRIGAVLSKKFTDALFVIDERLPVLTKCITASNYSLDRLHICNKCVDRSIVIEIFGRQI